MPSLMSCTLSKVSALTVTYARKPVLDVAVAASARASATSIPLYIVKSAGFIGASHGIWTSVVPGG